VFLLCSGAVPGCCVGQMHTKLKDELVGTTEQPTHPSAPVERAMYAAHDSWGRGPVWLECFAKEYLSIPRYPCFEEMRVGTWGDGGKWLCLTPLHKPAQDIVVYRYAAPYHITPVHMTSPHLGSQHMT